MTGGAIANGTRIASPRVAAEVRLLDVQDLAARLAVTERFVRRLVCERRIPFHKIGYFVRFDPCEVDRWVEDQLVEPIRFG